MNKSIVGISTKHKMIYILSEAHNTVFSLQVNHSASHLQNKFPSLPDFDTQEEAWNHIFAKVPIENL